MVLSDNETRVDMLNNRAIAKTIVNLIINNKEKPISIGVHGDWGAGKSSVLEMIEEEFEDKQDISCIKFNGWKHQGFEDAKIALMENIVTTLVKEHSLKTTASDVVKKIWKNINWLKVAKGAGSLAATALTGVPPISLINDAIDALSNNMKDADKVSETIENLGGFLSEAKLASDDSITKEFEEFQKSFDELLDKAKVSQLVVLIDDLDRCLPEVTIETLEAIRLFMFSKSTAFVIAADESMIEYAVTKHFPDLPDNDISKEFSRRYLEKLIQVPFKIPALGELEAKMYIILLLICSEFKEEDPAFKNLLVAAIEKIKRPWLNQELTITELQEILGDDYNKVSEQILMANQIFSILARGTVGNPRQIKRFINTLLLRYQIAEARGFSDVIQLPVLAKLMLVERFMSSIYEEIALETAENGICEPLALLEIFVAKKNGKLDSNIDKQVVEEEKQKAQKESKFNEWTKNKDLCDWAKIEPFIGMEDLRPYYFASKERKDYFFNQIQSEYLRGLIEKMMGGRMYVVNLKEKLKELSIQDSEYVFDIIAQKMLGEGNYKKPPTGIDGIRVLVEMHPELQSRLQKLIRTFPIGQVGAWICSGWDRCIISKEEKEKLREYMSELSTKGNEAVRTVAKAIKKI